MCGEVRMGVEIKKVEPRSLDVRSLLNDIDNLRKENCNLRKELRCVERKWKKKYWDLYERKMESDANHFRASQLKIEETHRKIEEQQIKSSLERKNVYNGYNKLSDEIERWRGEFCGMAAALVDEKIRFSDFMLEYKPMVVMQNIKKSSYDDLLVEMVCAQVCGLKKDFLLLKEKVSDIPHIIHSLVASTTCQIQSVIQETAEKYKDLLPKYKHEIDLRKQYHNELVDLRGNIRVLCRIRPPCQLDEGTSDGSDVPCVSIDSFDDGVIKVNNNGRCQNFAVDRVIPENATQSQVFDEVSSLVTSVLDGYNVCIFAYGQTGSGKTHTMEGPSDDPGINQRALKLLFDKAQESGWTYSIKASVLEVYNETIRDLLNPDAVKLEVKLKPEGGLHVPGLACEPVTSLHEANEIFSLGRRNRATGATNMNEHSSRSHCLLCVTVKGVNLLTGCKSVGCLNLVDLAGSERLGKSMAEGSRLKETQNINTSLSALGDVINALKNKHSHIPYRNSKLTYLLQESLGGNSKTMMILQVSSEKVNVSETVCTLSFGQRVRCAEMGTATKQVEGLKKGTPSQRHGADLNTKTTPSTTPTGRHHFLPKSCKPLTCSALTFR